MNIKRIIDILMTVSLIFLMSLQITDNEIHEYIGIAMIMLVIIHQYLNRKWFTTIFKGRYKAVRILSLTVNLALISAFILSAVSGMIISETFTFMNFERLTDFGRTAHICSSYWCFVLMGLHVGMHWGAVTAKIKSLWPVIAGVIFSGWGMYRFIAANIADYLVLNSRFVFLDYDKNSLLVILENIAMLSFCVLIGHELCAFTAMPREWRRPSANTAGMFMVCFLLILILGRPETF